MTLSLPPPVSGTATQHSLAWLSRPYEMLRQCAREHGDAFTLDLGAYGRYAIFAHPRAVKEIFTGDAHDLHAGKGNRVLGAFLGSGSLLLLEEERHLAERRLLMPAFHHAAIAGWSRAIVEIAADAISRWPDGGEIVAQQEMQRISLDVILRVVFGVTRAREEATRDELGRTLDELLDDPKMNLALMGRLDESGALETHASWRAFRARFDRARVLVRELIERRRREPTGEADVLLMLLQARTEDGGALGDEAIADELITLVVTGHETTATAISWGLHWLAIDEEARARTLAAIDAGAHRRPSDPWLDAVVRETLRLHPVIPIVARQAQREVRIDGWEIPAGVTVAPCIYLVHHREELYPDADRFRPQRFVDRNYGPYEWLPFGGGARRCLGANLALLEIKLVLGTVLEKLRVAASGEEVRPQRRSVTVAPSGGPRFFVQRRGEGCSLQPRSPL